MTLKEALQAGKSEILATIRDEAAQHAAKIDELKSQVAAGDLTAEELQAALAEIAGEVRGIVPDAAVPEVPAEDPSQPPAGTGE
ncbi:hypothetical protein GC170_14525 [bacterium]|nr:hypothetical protein [bacterium]